MMDHYDATAATIICNDDGETTLQFFKQLASPNVCAPDYIVGQKLLVTEDSCGAQVEVSNTTQTTDTNLPDAIKDILSSTRFFCTPCNWVFPNEDPPPYAILATGILVFLLICLFVNVFLKSKLDMLVRDRHIWFPTFFLPPQVPQGGKLIDPGTTVWVTTPEGFDGDVRRPDPSQKKKKELPTSEEVLFGLYDIAKALNGDGPEAYSPSEVQGSFRRASKAQNLSFAQHWDPEKNNEVMNKYKYSKRHSVSASEPTLAEPLLPRDGSPDNSLPNVEGVNVDQTISSQRSQKTREQQDSPSDTAGRPSVDLTSSFCSSLRKNVPPRGLSRGNYDAVDDILNSSMTGSDGCKRKRSIAGTPKGRVRGPSISFAGDVSQSPSWRRRASEVPRSPSRHYSDVTSELSSPARSPQDMKPGVRSPMDRRRTSFPTNRRKPSAAISEASTRRRQSDYTLEMASDIGTEVENNNRKKSKPDIFFEDEAITLREVSSDSESDVVESYRVHGTIDDDNYEHIVINLQQSDADDNDAVIDTYHTHSAPKKPSELLLSELSDQSGESPVILSPMSDSSITPNPLKKNRLYITPIRFCVVCGNRESDKNPLVKRDQGYKCKGDKSSTCIGKRPNQRLMFEKEVKELDSPDVVSAAVQGQLGSHGPVRKLRWRDREKEALVEFKSPTAWFPASAVSSLDESNTAKISELEQRNPQLVSGSYISKEKVTTWQYLASVFGYILTATDASGTWVAMKIESNICVWVPTRYLTKIGDFYGEYGRVGELEAMRVAAFTHWQEWWRDFAMCVGKIQEIKQIQKKTEVRYMVTIQFSESGHNISLPAETFTHATEEEYQKEYLLVPQPVPIRTMSAVFVVHPLLLAGKSIFLIGYFIYILSSTKPHSGTPWNHYQEMYFKLFNSGYPTLMADFGAVFMYRFTHQDVSLVITLRMLGKPIVAALGIAIGIGNDGQKGEV
eukprot:TRINITY_DN10274_c0_g1_i2.p1 TRINITY_DN10274_c0_g1~~TRINITY_DN10274_c0_g1_i2.p1  ORF type:complete len:1035 (+),score=175.69 TRINITY_DN10274_c0_g1_i2:234-3107(+)